METYGQQVRRARRQRGWTQKELAAASGVPVRTIQDIEADKSGKPHRGNVLALNGALSIEGDPEQERSTWPNDVQTILDIVGAHLMTLSPEERIRWLSRLSMTGVGDQ